MTANVAATAAKKLTSKTWRKSSSPMSTRRMPGVLCRVVDQHVDGSVRPRHLLEDAAQRARVGHVARVRRRFRRVLAQLHSQRVQPRRVARQPDDRRPGPGQVAAQLGAEPGRRAGDDDDLVGVAPAVRGRSGLGGTEGESHSVRWAQPPCRGRSGRSGQSRAEPRSAAAAKQAPVWPTTSAARSPRTRTRPAASAPAAVEHAPTAPVPAAPA